MLCLLEKYLLNILEKGINRWHMNKGVEMTNTRRKRRRRKKSERGKRERKEEGEKKELIGDTYICRSGGRGIRPDRRNHAWKSSQNLAREKEKRRSRRGGGGGEAEREKEITSTDGRRRGSSCWGNIWKSLRQEKVAVTSNFKFYGKYTSRFNFHCHTRTECLLYYYAMVLVSKVISNIIIIIFISIIVINCVISVMNMNISIIYSNSISIIITKLWFFLFHFLLL